MRVSREKAAANRERIVETAARLFREKGVDGIGIDALMSSAGLTHGGFYGHFASKDELVAEAVGRALERGAEEFGRYASLGDLVAEYLSELHLTNVGDGCAVAALAPEMARQGGAVRRGLTGYVRQQIDRFSGLLHTGSVECRRRRAIATLAGMIGALTLARAIDDPALSKEILEATCDALGERRAASPTENDGC